MEIYKPTIRWVAQLNYTVFHRDYDSRTGCIQRTFSRLTTHHNATILNEHESKRGICYVTCHMVRSSYITNTSQIVILISEGLSNDTLKGAKKRDVLDDAALQAAG